KRFVLVGGQRVALFLVLTGLAVTRAPAGFQGSPLGATANDVFEVDSQALMDASVPTTAFVDQAPQLAWHGHCGANRSAYYGHYGNYYQSFYGGYGTPYRTYRPVNVNYYYGSPYQSYYYRQSYYGPSGYGYGSGYPNSGGCHHHYRVW
ncbi:MAG TPA: hypothetical protein VIY86_03375, partial [Pirellulaceae bacterium]